MPHDALHWTSLEIGFDFGVLQSVPDDKESKKALAEGRKVKEEAKRHGSNGNHSKGRNPDRS